jgi:hypothetical protein
MPQPAYDNLCWPQVESDEARRHLYFHWSVNISGKPYLQRPCIIVCSDIINKDFGNESYFKFSSGNFNYRGESPNATPNKDWWRWGRRLPQRHSHHLSESARLNIIMQIRDMCSVYIGPGCKLQKILVPCLVLRGPLSPPDGTSWSWSRLADDIGQCKLQNIFLAGWSYGGQNRHLTGPAGVDLPQKIEGSMTRAVRSAPQYPARNPLVNHTTTKIS